MAILPVVVHSQAPPLNPPPPPAAELDTIVVQGQKLSVETKIDRKIYTVPEDAQSTLGALSDILSVIPSVDVDPDGVISLRGDSNVLVLIDGKPSTALQGSKAGENLQSMSARDIERIEVLSTPPAQFKADGAAGVINIITRHKVKQSASGSVQGSLGDGGRRLLAADGSYGSKRFNASLNAGFRQDYRQRTIRSEVTGPDPTTGVVLQSHNLESQRLRRNIPNIGLTGEFYPNDSQSVSGSANWLRRGGLRTYAQTEDSEVQQGGLSSSTQRFTSGHDPEDDFNTALRFSQKLPKPGETLDLTLHRSLSHQHEHYDYINNFFVPPAATSYNSLDFVEDHGISGADLDYAVPLWKSQSLKLGYAFEQDDYGFERAGTNVELLSGPQTIDAALSNDFKFHQRVHALYVSGQGSLGRWNWLAGLRSEWTSTDALLISSDLSVPQRYASLFPSVHLDRSLTDRSTLSFGASRRVTRPDPSYLNPYVDHEYPPNLTAGNPALRPQFTQSFDLGYQYEGGGASYALVGYYRRNRDSVTDVTEYLGAGMSLTTKSNLPRSDAAGVEFSATGRLAPKLSYSISGNAFHAQIDGTALGSPGLESTTGVNLKAKLDCRPTPLDSAQIAFIRTDKRLTPQGRISAINLVNLGYKRALTRALSAVATVSDLFNGQRYQRIAITPLFAQTYRRDVEGRVAFVGLIYSFGVTQKDSEHNFDYDSGN